jgi:predicted phosphodiesterase
MKNTEMTRRILFLLAACATLQIFAAKEDKDPLFFEKPYIQLGDRPAPSEKEALELMWMGHDLEVVWKVEYRDNGTWRPATVRTVRRVDAPDTPAHRVYAATLADIKPGTKVAYQISVGGKKVFESSALSRRPANANSKFVVFGDCAANTSGQRGVAFYAAKENPDYVFITGDIVYSRGRVSEYQEKFWPIYNADKADPKKGAPLLRNTLFTGVVGNHDVAPEVDFDKQPDALAYYQYWSQPLNGPALSVGQRNTPRLKGSEAAQKRFLSTVNDVFPRMANFSFDYGNVHWTVLDSNVYVDWTTPEFRTWVREDLKKAAGAKWRVVGLHHPPFNSSKAHFNEQRVRVLADLFEEGGVSIVFAGHVHNYQRTHPLRFEVEKGFVLGKENKVPGKWTLDKNFNGAKNNKPNGVVYLVTGAGGANLYNTEQNGDPATWQEFTTKFVSNIHSFTVVEANSERLQVRQVGADGKEVDRFTISR